MYQVASPMLLAALRLPTTSTSSGDKANAGIPEKLDRANEVTNITIKKRIILFLILYEVAK
jgi:hypothetical protein